MGSAFFGYIPAWKQLREILQPGDVVGHLSLSYRLDHGLRRLEFRHLDRIRVRLFGFLFFGHSPFSVTVGATRAHDELRMLAANIVFWPIVGEVAIRPGVRGCQRLTGGFQGGGSAWFIFPVVSLTSGVHPPHFTPGLPATHL